MNLIDVLTERVFSYFFVNNPFIKIRPQETSKGREVNRQSVNDLMMS